MSADYLASLSPTTKALLLEDKRQSNLMLQKEMEDKKCETQEVEILAQALADAR